MSVVVVLNSMELLVDLMRFPGQLIPRSTKAIFMTHISAAGESDSAENDSCDSPMEPNSPLYGVSERVDPERLAAKEFFFFLLATKLLLDHRRIIRRSFIEFNIFFDEVSPLWIRDSLAV